MIAHVNDIKIHFEDHGEGKPLVLLHGLALNGSIWDEVVTLYSDQARFIVPDLRGHGKTNTGAANGSLEQFADDLLALADYLKLEKFTLAGHSMGGYVALVFAEKYPERLDGLIMVTSNARSDIPEKQKSRHADAELAMSAGMAALSETMVQKYTAPVNLRRQIIPIIENTDPRGFANVQHAIAWRKNQLGHIKDFNIPLLAIAGSDDQLMKPEVACEMAQAAKLGSVVILPGTGHLPMLEEPLTLGALMVSAL